MGGPSSSQDLMEEIEEIEEVTDTPVSDVNEYIFKPRVRNPALNRVMSFNIDYKHSAGKEFGSNSAVEDEFDETLDVYTEDDTFLKLALNLMKVLTIGIMFSKTI